MGGASSHLGMFEKSISCKYFYWIFLNLVASNASELPALEFNLADFSLKDLPELSLNDMLNLIWIANFKLSKHSNEI